MHRGANGSDAIDANGMQIAAIKELSKRMQNLQKRMAAVKAKKKGH